MKKFLLCAIIVLLSGNAVLYAFGSSGSSKKKDCETKYPIVLVHGMNCNIDSIHSFEVVKQALEDEGAEVYRTWVNAMDGTFHKGEQFRNEILQIMAASGAQKVNIIAHSHGSVYSRYAISNLGLGDKIASWTGLCGPHRGSVLADILMGILPDAWTPAISWIVGLFYPADVDGNPSQNGYDLTRGYMTDVFNPNTPNVQGIYYQSWAAKIKYPQFNDAAEATWAIMLPFEGANDGIVSVKSAKWGNYRGELSGAAWSSGLAHNDVINGGDYPGFNSSEFFCDVVSELKDMGF